MEIKAHFREGRNKPWEARWWVNRKMRTRFFPTEKERDKFIREFQREIRQNDVELYKIHPSRLREWQRVDRVLPEVSPVELAEYWLLNHQEKDEKTFSTASCRA